MARPLFTLPQRVAEPDQVMPLQYRVVDAARLMAVSQTQVKGWIASGRLSVRGQGRLRRIPLESILKLLAELDNESERR